MPKLLGEKDGTSTGTVGLVKKDRFYTLQAKFSRTYYVLSDNLSQNEATIIATSGIPPLLSLLSGAWCMEKKGKEITRVIHPVTGVPAVLWEVTASFDSDVDVDEADQSPEARTPKVRWYGENEEELLEKDAITGDAIQTVPGEPILIEVPYVRPILEVKRFELPPFDPDTQLDFANHTNSAAFYGAPEGTALMLPIEASEEQVVDQVRVITVTYKVKFNIKEEGGGMAIDTWKAKPLHHGFKFFPAVGEPAEVYNDKHGNPATINLAADGTQLGDGDNPVFLSFNRFPKANLNLLNLGPF